MKKKGHPKYQEVLFIDTSTGFKFICGSTLQTKEKEVFEGKEYPVCRVAISSASHPFFVGGKQFVDTEGRIEKFTKKYKRKEVEKKEVKPKEKEEKPKKVAKKTPKKAIKKPVKKTTKKVKVRKIEEQDKKTS